MTELALLLALIGSLSPLLTLAWLWQLKEWRTDRLLEHLRREGAVSQLWGRARPLLGIVAAFLLLLPGVPRGAAIVGGTALFAVLSAAQIALRRQRRPVRTQKALAVTGAAAALTAVAGVATLRAGIPEALPFLPLLQPLALAVAWAALLPLDAFLKRRVFAAARAARAAHRHLRVIGITGSVGKTTTKELLSCVLKDLNPIATPAHVNTEMGVAGWLIKTLAALPPDSDAVLVVEMGAYKKGEIDLLCSVAEPSMGVVTHVGQQHIALFGSQEKLLEAKSELVRALPPHGRAFLNGDNALSRRMIEWAPCPVTVVGTGGRSDLEAFDIAETPKGIRFRASNVAFEVPLPGTHNVTNVLLAIAVADALGIPAARASAVLKDFAPLSKTFEIREEAGVRILDDTHNGSAASIKAAIAWARNQPERRKVLLTSGLIEMGEYQAPAERELGALAGQTFERTVVLSKLSAQNFAAGGARNAEEMTSSTARVERGTLLVCAGRMPASMVRRMLPSS